MTPLRAWIGVVLLASLGCDAGPERLDWLDPGARVERAVERTRWAPTHLKTPWNAGFHAPHARDGEHPWVWSARDESRIQLEVHTPGPRTLRLWGFPAPNRPARPQQVEVRLNEEALGAVAWTEEAVRELPVPADLLYPGRNELRLRYGYVIRPAEVDPTSRDGRRLSMAWREIALLPAEPMTPAAGESEQGRGEIRWRWLAAAPEATLHVSGRAGPGGVEVSVVLDAGAPRWSVTAQLTAGGGERLDHRVPLTDAPPGVVRVGVLVTRGQVRWDRMSSTQPRRDERRPPVVLVTVDTTRRDAFGVYNGDPAASPTFDALAEESVVWDLALSPTPTTAPTHAGIFLARYPAHHGLTTNGRPLPQRGPAHLLHQFRARGYETAAFVSIGVLKADLGFDQGFDLFGDAMAEGWWRFAREVNEAALPWIAQHPAGPDAPPRFLWVHYCDPHKPYGVEEDPGRGATLAFPGTDRPPRTVPTHGRIVDVTLDLSPGDHPVVISTPPSPEPTHDGNLLIGRTVSVLEPRVTRLWGEGWEMVRGYRRMRERASLVLRVPDGAPRPFTLRLRLTDVPTPEIARRRYREEVRAMDQAFADLMDQLRRSGWLQDGLVLVVGDHGEELGEDGHYGHVEHVGSVLSDVPMFLRDPTLSPRRIATPVSVIDAAPTLLARLGWEIPGAWRGVDALDPPGDRAIHLETFPPEAERHWRGVVLGPWKLAGVVDDGTPSPTLISLDGTEASPAVRAELRRRWDAWDVGGAAEETEIDPAMLERLRALGYVQ